MPVGIDLLNFYVSGTSDVEYFASLQDYFNIIYLQSEYEHLIKSVESTFDKKYISELKKKSMLLSDKIFLRKRTLIETVIDELKNICQIEHTRYRSQEGFTINLIAGLIAYYHLPKKPSLNLEIINTLAVNL